MRRALGKGLSHLLADSVAEPGPSQIEIGIIHPNSRQPRRVFDDDQLRELAESIKIHGVIQPLIVRPLGQGEFELIAGERRLRAAMLAGLTQVPAVVRPASAQVSLELALIENIQREDISAMDCAYAFRRLIDEFSLTQEEAAHKVGKSRTAVANTLRLLKLPEEIQDAVQMGAISEGHARALLMIDSPARQMQVFQKCVRDGISVREAERLARQEPARLPEAPEQLRPEDASWKSLERGLGERLGAVVKIKRKGDQGKVEVEFSSLDDLTRIVDILGFRLD
jgi:ParB family transcriptional regulator, chromosome partitioning protein